MNSPTRVRVWSTVKMVSLRGDIVSHDGKSRFLYGITDSIANGVCAVKIDDGCEVLVACEHLEAETS